MVEGYLSKCCSKREVLSLVSANNSNPLIQIEIKGLSNDSEGLRIAPRGACAQWVC